jgi:hypothetical protein
VNTYSGGRDVGKIGGDTRGVDHIVKGELVDKRRELEEKRERLQVISCHSLENGERLCDKPGQCRQRLQQRLNGFELVCS